MRHYDASTIEKNGREFGKNLAVLPPVTIIINQNIMCWKCFPTHPAGYIWDMCEIIHSETW